MKRFLLMGMMLGVSLSVAAAETAHIDVSGNIGREQCATQLGAGAQSFQLIVQDSRPNPSVGSLKKGDATTDVMLDEKVATVFDKALRSALTNCGYRVVNAAPTKVTVSVTDFFAASTKALLKGDTNANARFTVRIDQGDAQQSMEFALAATDSGMGAGKLKRLQANLAKVLTGTIEQMITSQTFVGGLKQVNQNN